MCLHGTLCSVPFNLLLDHVLKKLHFDLLTPRVRGGAGGSRCKIFATKLLHS